MAKVPSEVTRKRRPASTITEEEFKALLKSKIGGFKMRAVYKTGDAQIVNVFFLATV